MYAYVSPFRALSVPFWLILWLLEKSREIEQKTYWRGTQAITYISVYTYRGRETDIDIIKQTDICLSLTKRETHTPMQREERDNQTNTHPDKQTDTQTDKLTDGGVMDPILPLTLRGGGGMHRSLSVSQRARDTETKAGREREKETTRRTSSQTNRQIHRQTNRRTEGGHDGPLALLCPAFPCFALPCSALRGPILSVSLSLRETETPIPGQKQRETENEATTYNAQMYVYIHKYGNGSKVNALL